MNSDWIVRLLGIRKSKNSDVDILKTRAIDIWVSQTSWAARETIFDERKFVFKNGGCQETDVKVRVMIS